MRPAPALTALLVAALSLGASADPWPGFRGRTGLGTSTERTMATKWTGTQNVTWKVKLPAPGNSSPIVWEDKVFLTTQVAGGKQRGIICIDRADGRMLWNTTVDFNDDEPTHQTNPYCASTPVTDGKAVYAWLGSAGVLAVDMDGQALWHRDLGPIHHIWGTASSPILYEDTVILYAGPGNQVTLLAMDRATGRTVWQKPMPQSQNTYTNASDKTQWIGSWSTPILIRNEGRDELVLSDVKQVLGINPKTGQTLWRCGGLTDLVYTSAVVGEGYIVAQGGFKGPAIGLRLPGAGDGDDVTQTHRLWRHDKAIPQRIGSGIIHRGHFYFCNEPGVAECIELETGKTVWKHRVGKKTWGSMSMVAGQLYVTDSDGTTHVIAPSTTFRRIATNLLDGPEITRATPAFSDGQVFLRTYDHLYCFGLRSPR